MISPFVPNCLNCKSLDLIYRHDQNSVPLLIMDIRHSYAIPIIYYVLLFSYILCTLKNDLSVSRSFALFAILNDDPCVQDADDVDARANVGIARGRRRAGALPNTCTGAGHERGRVKLCLVATCPALRFHAQ